jgi:hypothetical protein
MPSIETTATIADDGTLTASAPRSIPRGEYRVKIVLDELPPSAATPRKWPDMAAFRARLETPAYAGNAVVEMREEERS